MSAEIRTAIQLGLRVEAQSNQAVAVFLLVFAECVVCGDVPEDPVVSVCNHVYCAQCVSAQISLAGHGAAGRAASLWVVGAVRRS